MKKLSLCLAVLLFSGLIGCSSFQIENSKVNNMLAYSAGRAMGTYINEARPEVDNDLTDAWVTMMESQEENEMVNSIEMIAFYNHCLVIITGREFDKYGLIGDLQMLLTIYGGEINGEGQMIAINPVPLAIMKTFEVGYAYGRAMARR